MYGRRVGSPRWETLRALSKTPIDDHIRKSARTLKKSADSSCHFTRRRPAVSSDGPSNRPSGCYQRHWSLKTSGRPASERQRWFRHIVQEYIVAYLREPYFDCFSPDDPWPFIQGIRSKLR